MNIFEKINKQFNNSSSNKLFVDPNSQTTTAINVNSQPNQPGKALQDLIDQWTQQSVQVPAVQGVGGMVTFPMPTVPFQFPPPLDSSEQEELKRLREERAVRAKQAKLEKFKSLPKDYRQSIVNHYMWDEVVNEMDSTQGELSEREIELSSRDYSSHFSGTFSKTFQDRLAVGPRLPNGITAQDLVQAHLDASMEEELGDE